MDVGEIALYAAIWSAVAAWAASEWLRPREPRAARAAWSAAAAVTILHSVLAFHVRYRWDHAVAVADAARQTAAVTSVSWGEGLYVNYVFLTLWAADAAWWWAAPGSYAARARALDGAMRGFVLFMFLNGAFVFVPGAQRWAGLVAVCLAAFAWSRGRGAERVSL